jgi:type I restriction enzyme S subunit
MSDVSEDGDILGASERSYESVKNGFPGFQENDVLVAKITPCFENGKGALVRGLSTSIGFGSTEFLVLRARPQVAPEFLFVHTRTKEFRSHGEANMTGSAGQQRVHPSFIRDWTIPLPPAIEQRNIADILLTWDQTVKAEKALRARLLFMYQGVSHRLIQARGDEMHPLGQLLVPDKMQPMEPDGPFRALSVRSHGKGAYERVEQLAALGSGKIVYRIEPNRFIVNIVFAWEGAAAITSDADSGCLVSHRFPAFTINEKLVDTEYLRHLIRTEWFRQLLVLASPGGAGRNKTLNRRDLLLSEIQVPPLPKQRAIAKALNTLDRQISFLNRHITGLAKQRDALATQLLTGRLRVPEALGAAEPGD